MAVPKGVEPSSSGRQPDVIAVIRQNLMATNAGFEPADELCPSPAFETGAINQPLPIRQIWRRAQDSNLQTASGPSLSR